MNCQDIARMLDDGRIDELRVAEHQAALVHLAGCSACTRDWHVHRLLVSEAIPPVPPELRAQFVPGSAGASDAKARRQSRFILIGTLFVVAAAAAVFTTQLIQAPVELAEALSSAPMVPAERPSAGLETQAQMLEAPVTGSLPVVAAAPAAQPAAVAQPIQPRFVVLLMPTRHESPEESARPVVDAFQVALVKAFGHEPDLAVVPAVDGKAPDGVEPTHLLTVASTRFTELSDGTRVYQHVDGSTGSVGIPPGQQGRAWAADVMLHSVGDNPAQRLAIWPMLGAHGIPIQGVGCGVAGFTRSGPELLREMMQACGSADGMAAVLVRALRNPPEPVTDPVAQQLARLRDGTARPTERLSVLNQLLIQARTSGVALDASVVDTARQLLLGQTPDQRVQAINMMRFSNQPVFTALLTEFMQRDASEPVRLAALTALAASSGGDDRVRGAFAAVAQQDASQLVRMAARHQLPGDVSWQPYVLSTLANPQLPPADRVAPIMLAARMVTGPPNEGEMRDFLRTDGVLAQLGDVVKAMHATPTENSAGSNLPGEGPFGGAIQNILQMIERQDQGASIDLRIHLLTNNPRPHAVHTLTSLLTLMSVPDNPRVARVLQEIESGKHGLEMQRIFEEQRAMRQMRQQAPPNQPPGAAPAPFTPFPR